MALSKLRQAIPTLAIVVVFKVPYEGNPSLWGNGTVADDVGKPIPDVIVYRQDYADAIFGGTSCDHVAFSRSRKDGTFFMPPWLGFRAADRKNLIVYRRGYAMTAVSKSGFRISVTRHDVSNEERLAYLDSLAMSVKCLGAPSQQVIALFEQIIDEESALIATSGQRRQYLEHAQELLATERERVQAWEQKK